MLMLLPMLLGLAAAETASDLDRVKVGERPPEFSLPDAGGIKHNLAGYRGRNLVLVFYRGYW